METDTVDATDVPQFEIEHGLGESLSEEEEVPDKSPKEAKREVLIQASLMEENKIAQDNHNQAPRYFNTLICSRPSDNKYGKNNDEGKACTARKKRKPCYVCGDIGHAGMHCKQVNDGFICSKNGHLVIGCPNKNVEEDSTCRLCLICGGMGHHMFSCTNGYESDDLKAIECYVCKKVGHLCCVDNKAEGPREASCYNCGQSGHFGFECTKSNDAGNYLQSVPLCSKCGERGHFRRKCKAKKKASKASRDDKAKSTPTESQPNTKLSPQIVGPYNGKPGPNVSLSSAAAASSSLNHQAGPSPSPQHINHQVGTQQVNSFYSAPRLPHLLWNSLARTQVPRIPLNQVTGIMLPQTQTQIPPNAFHPMIQHPHPLTLLPHLIWNSLARTQIPQIPLKLDSGIMIPQTQTQIPQNPLHSDSTSPSYVSASSSILEHPDQDSNSSNAS